MSAAKYTCRVASGEPKPTDPSLGCEHGGLGLAVQHAFEANMSGISPAMRTYAGRVDGSAWSVDEVPPLVRDEVTRVLAALSEGRYVNTQAKAVLVAMGLIKWVPAEGEN